MTLGAVTTIRRAVNVVVYVSDALRADHLGCYGARFLNTRTIDELAAGGTRFDQAISAAPWTAPSMTSMVTGLYPHHHGYLHWDAELAPTTETLFRALGAHGYDVGTFVFDSGYLFKGMPEANVLGTSETLDGAMAWLRERGDRPFLLFFHSWATHMPYSVPHSERTDWRAAKQEVLAGIQADSASALEATREAYRQAVERQSETLVASLLEELERLGLREQTAFAFLSDHGESWGERFAEKDDVKGVYHMHGATLYDEVVQVPLVLSALGGSSPRSSAPRCGRSTSCRRSSSSRASRAAPSTARRSSRSSTGARTRTAPPSSSARTAGPLAARRPDAAVEADPRRRERGGGGVPPGRRPARARQPPGRGARGAARARLPRARERERRELTEEEEATVARRLADLGYL